MQEYRFLLKITYLQFMSFYEQQAQYVHVKNEQGKDLYIHARHFIPFLTYSGIEGRFLIRVDAQGNMVSLSRVH